MKTYSHTSRIIVVAALATLLLAHVAHAEPTKSLRAGRTGTLAVKNTDCSPPCAYETMEQLLLVDDEGNETPLKIDAGMVNQRGGLKALGGRRITVVGGVSGSSAATMTVEDIQIEGPNRVAMHPVPSFGARPWVTILCRYSDDSSTPETKSWVQTLMTGTAFPSVDHYFREISFNNLNFSGSLVVGWYTLPQPYSYYNWDKNGNGWPEFDYARAITDAVAKAEADVNFPNFVGIHMFFNRNPACDVDPTGGVVCASSMFAYPVTADGQTRNYGVSCIGPWGYHLQTVVCHELMHTLGVHHSAARYDYIQDHHWDIMSWSGLCAQPHAEYGCLGVDTISYHLWELGWIHPVHQFDAGAGKADIITLERLDQSPLNPGIRLAAKLPMGGSATKFYTVETRRLAGYDGLGAIPGDAVIICDVDTQRIVYDDEGRAIADRYAQVIDIDNNGNADDDGARWLPGEGFEDTTNQVVVFVESSDAVSSVVSLSNKARSTVYVNPANSGAEDGTAQYPWNTAKEGYAGAYLGGNVYLTPISYNEKFRMAKPCTLRRFGTTGSVIIGQ